MTGKDDAPTNVVEMDAMDVEEWDRDRHTPVAVDTNLAALVKQSTTVDDPKRAPTQPPIAPVADEAWGDDTIKAPPTAKTSQNTVRRTSAVPIVPESPPAPAATPRRTVAGPAVPAVPAKKPSVPPGKTPPALTKKATAPAAKPAEPVKPVSAVAAKPAAEPVKPASAIAAKPVAAKPIAAKPAAANAAATKPEAANAAAANAAPANATPARPAAVPRPTQLAAAAATPRATTNQDFNDVTALEPREPSVVIDLNAKAAAAGPAWPRAQSPVVLQTSEHTTTTSGAFVMPTAEAPTSVRPQTNPDNASHALAQSMDWDMPSTTNADPIEVQPSPHEPAARPGAAPPKPTPVIAPARTPLAPLFSSSSPAPIIAPIPAPVPLASMPAPIVAPVPAPQAAPIVASVAPAPAPQAVPIMHSPTSPTAPEPEPPSAAAPTPQALEYLDSPAPLRRSLLATILPTPKSRRIALISGGAVALVLVLVLALGGKPSAAPTETAHAVEPTPAPVQKPAAAAPAKPEVVATAEPTTTSEPSIPATTPKATPRTAPPQRVMRAKKPVVVDYDKQKPVQQDLDESLARARTAYAMGNQHLFTGETDAAITAYRQALADYPNYAAGYRGLGLAYSQQSDKTAAALKAFKTYVSLAPTAKDVELIKKRIARLSAH